MATGKSCSRWFAAMAALLMVVSLSGCFDKEGDQRKAFIDLLQNAKMQADAAHGALKQADDLKPVFDQVYAKVVTAPADALQPLIPAAQIFTQQLVQVGDFVAQQGTQVSFVANGIQFPTSQQASQYNALIGPLAAQHQAFNQAWTAAVNATR